MEEMKYVENPVVNKKVVKIVEILKEEIISKFHPKSVILSGSFGKGEATVIENGGCLRFLSDCEVIIIPDKYIFNRGKIKQFSEIFYEWTGLKVSISAVVLSIYLLFPFLNRKLKPTMENYDLKYGSKVIYGKDYLERIPDFKPEDIPLWEAIRLLFNRMAEALDYFSLKNPSKEMVFWTDKIILACQDALFLSLGKYHYSYRKRNEMFQNLFSKYFSELEDELLRFLDLTIEATERKLNGTMDVDDPVKYWFDTAEICDKVFRYVIKKDMGIEFKDYLEFQKAYIKNPKIEEYRHEIIQSHIYQNLIALSKMAMGYNGFISLKIITKMRTSWRHFIYSLIPLIYFSISRDCTINEYYLDRAREVLSLFKNLERSNKKPFEEFEYIKKEIINFWRDVC